MQRRSVLFITLNIILSVGVALGAIWLFGDKISNRPPLPTSPVITILVTTTPGPTQTPFLITATLAEGQVLLPTGLVTPGTRTPNSQGDDGTQSANPGPTTLPGETINGTAVPAGCIIHTVEAGDTPFGLAGVYGVSGFDIMAVNGLTEETASLLQVGQQLIIPLEGCPLTIEDIATATDTAEPNSSQSSSSEETPEATSNVTLAPTATPTVTLAPTAANAAVTITNILSAGDVTAEGVEIRNDGALIDLTGWTLTDADGNVFTFPDQHLFTGGLVTVYTRVGTNTSIALFWNRNTAVWATNDVATLRDEDGVVQSTYRVQNARNLPQ